ncbi:MAG: hypothetical protein ABIO68_00850 [Sphingomicrobium sp.]
MTLRVGSGAQAEIGLDPAGKARMLANQAEPLSAAEIGMIERFVRDHPDAFGPKAAPMTTGQWLTPIKRDRIRFRFVPFSGGAETVLVIENGSELSFIYKARIGRGSSSMMTDVCQVVPGKRGIEHWPYQIDWIEITNVRAIPYVDGSQPLCE